MLEEREKGQGYRDKNDTAQVREVGRGSRKCRALAQDRKFYVNTVGSEMME